METKNSSFIDFLKKKYCIFSFLMPLWIFIILSSLVNSSKLLQNGGTTIFDYLFDAFGGVVFVTFLVYIYYLLFGKKKMQNRDNKK